jgi:hypothetical protein
VENKFIHKIYDAIMITNCVLAFSILSLLSFFWQKGSSFSVVKWWYIYHVLLLRALSFAYNGLWTKIGKTQCKVDDKFEKYCLITRFVCLTLLPIQYRTAATYNTSNQIFSSNFISRHECHKYLFHIDACEQYI